MQKDSVQPQEEPRPEQVNVRLTQAEKADVKLVSAFDMLTEAEVVRAAALESIRQRAADIRAGRVTLVA
jgi:hypothetical protein